MKIGICTGGGDCPGLNAVIRAVVKYAIGIHRCEVIGIENSLTGLMSRPLRTRRLGMEEVTPILERGGTILGTSSRGLIFDDKDNDQIPLVIEGYRQLGLDCLIIVGGEGTQKLAQMLISQGINIVGIPKTIDNDLPGTQQTVGFSTAADIATDALSRLRSTAESHDRIMILEVMGRDSGYLAMHSGIAGGANVILIPEIPFEYDPILAKVEERRQLGRHFSVIVAAEGAYVAGGQPVFKDADAGTQLGGIGARIASVLHQKTGMETRVTVLGHVQRGGAPNREDRVLATLFGVRAVDLAVQQRFGRFVALVEGDVQDAAYSDIEPGQRKKIELDNPIIAAAERIGICLGRASNFQASVQA